MNTLPATLRSGLRTLLACLAACVAGLPPLFAQQAREPHIGYAFPAGGRRGATFEITVGGVHLDGARDAFVSGSGVRLTVIEVYKPLTGKRYAELQNILQAARTKPLASGTAAASVPKAQSPANPGTPAAPPAKPPVPARVVATGTPPAPARKAPGPAPGPEGDAQILRQAGVAESEISKFIARRDRDADPKRQPNQQIAETVTLKAEIAADARTGSREVRLITPLGMSNPLTFCVGNLSEQSAGGSVGTTVDTATRVALPVVLNGQILPGAVHRFSFQARRGAHLVIVAQARDLIPYLADTVPGWFQAAVALYDAKGNQVAYGDHYRFRPDPVLYYQVPADGVYLIEIRDALYRGREDFVYRVSVGEIPFVTDIFPLGGQLGMPARVGVSGYNLPYSRVTLAPAAAEGVYPVPFLSDGLATGDVLFACDALPQYAERKANNAPSQAQRVTPPVVINGRIDRPGDIDAFAFSCRAGEKIVAEVYARRLNSPLDSWLKVTDSKGHQLGFNDDCEDKGAGLLTHCADSRLIFTASSNGLYNIELGDSQGNGGPEYSYRLRISDPRPDFALRVVPSGISARPGATVPITVYALRKDGFAGDISLTVTGGSSGLLLNGGRVPAGQDQVRVTLTFPPVPEDKPESLAIEGHAIIQGRDVVRPAVPADEMIQAFMYHHLVPAKQMVAAVSGTARGRDPITMMSPQPMILKAGGTGQAVVSLQGRSPFAIAQTKLQLSQPPDGITIGGISPATNGAAISFKADGAKVKPGLKGNLILEAFAERTAPAINGATPGKIRWPLGFLPAIPFEVVGAAMPPGKPAGPAP